MIARSGLGNAPSFSPPTIAVAHGRSAILPIPARTSTLSRAGQQQRTQERKMGKENKENKVAIVTGGSRGLGRDTVLSLAKRGVNAILTYHANRPEADKVVAAGSEARAKAVALRLDTSDVRSFDAFVQSVRSSLAGFGAERFDYLVNNAGTSLHKSFEQTTEEELDKVYNVHFKGVFFLTQKLLPLMNDGGRGIAVNTVAPGAIATDFSGGMVRDNPEVNKRVAGMTALGRAGVPDDIGPTVN